jgi:ribose/xylose/arabinose/galactoside ABC-type transport system permease subunit
MRTADPRIRPSRRRSMASTVRRQPDRSHSLVRLVTRFIVAQAAIATAIGLAYSRRHLPSIIITLMLVVALLGVAALTRSGTHAAWMFAIGFESAFIMFGLFRFFTSRYLGGTLFAIVELGVLLHPAVARAFSGVPRPAEGHPSLRDANGEAFGGRATG